MGTWTLYSAGGDLTLLNAIFNGVAMICSQTALIWGFAMLASVWLILRAVAAGAVQSAGGNGGAALSQGTAGAFMPLILAMLLTAPGAQCTVQVQSNTTGAITSVANVPFVIAAIPVGGSIMASNIGIIVTTAFSSANASYDVISASGNGFLDPMKRLLGARTAIQRLSALDSELKMVVSSCLGPDAGTDYTALNNMVVNAGNTGANSSQSLSINGSDATGIGALLYQVSLNTVGLVPQLAINNPAIMNCPTAATQVQTDINAALASQEFARVIQGAINGMDQPQAGANYAIGQLQTEYTTLRQWNSVGATLGNGTQQANSEMINFLFAEEVANSLNCAQAAGSDKATCESTLIQSSELERNNIQAAANEVPMLQYAGSFGNYILALIIGLGPVIVMFMMFAGVSAGKCIKTAVHITVWPLLVTNVGAELVNAMISLQFSNFLASVAQGGYLSPATMLSAYKELSLQVGVGSHIMASLPVLMSMIFALGETAALTSVVSEVTPKGREVGESMAPSPVAAAPLMRMSSPVTDQQGIGFHNIKATGALDSVSSTQTFMSMGREATNTVTDSEALEKRETQDVRQTRSFAESLGRRDYASLGLTEKQGEALSGSLMNSLRASKTAGDSTSVDSRSDSQTSSRIGASANAGLKTAVIPVDLSTGVDASTSAGATDSKSLAQQVSKASNVDLAKAVSKTLSSTTAQDVIKSQGTDGSRSLTDTLGASNDYVTSASHRQDHTTATGVALKKMSGFVGLTQGVHAAELANHATKSRQMQQFQLNEGHAFDASPVARKYMAEAEEGMSNFDTDAIGGNEQAKKAVLRHQAAVRMAGDTSLTERQQFEAAKYLVDEGNAMVHGNFEMAAQGALTSQNAPIPLPKNGTGFNQPAMVRQVHAATDGYQNLHPHVTFDENRQAKLHAAGDPSSQVDDLIPSLQAPSANAKDGPEEVFTERVKAENDAGRGRGENHEDTAHRALVGAAENVGSSIAQTAQRLLHLLPGTDEPAPVEPSPVLPVVDPLDPPVEFPKAAKK